MHSAVSIPLFVAFKSGKVIAKLTGKDEEKLTAFVEEYSC